MERRNAHDAVHQYDLVDKVIIDLCHQHAYLQHLHSFSNDLKASLWHSSWFIRLALKELWDVSDDKCSLAAFGHVTTGVWRIVDVTTTLAEAKPGDIGLALLSTRETSSRRST